MAVLSWGKPKIDVAVSTNGEPSAGATWREFPEIKENTAKLTPTKGTKTEATQEGGETVDVRYSKNKFAFECEVFVKKGDTRHIEDVDGLVVEDYALRLTPEDDGTEGFRIDCATVSVEESWTSADGKMLKYTFDVKKPAAGKMIKPYTALVVAPKALSFTSAADTTGQSITATCTGTVTASSDQTWATTSVASKVVTVKVTANAGGSRTAKISILADGKQATVLVTQAAV
jgi:hypothetical protein